MKIIGYLLLLHVNLEILFYLLVVPSEKIMKRYLIISAFFLSCEGEITKLEPSDADGDGLTYALASLPSSGVVSGAAPNLTYEPNPDFNGVDSFMFTASDGTVDSAPVTVSITVTAVNAAPLADAQAIKTAEDTAANVVLTGSDVDGDALTYSVASSPTNSFQFSR